MSESIHFHEITAAERQELLDAFAENPTDEATWSTAYDWVRTEGDSDTQSGTVAGIPAEELIALATTVRDTPQQDRYDLMAGHASDGRRWFDVLETFSSVQSREAKDETIASWVYQDGNAVRFRAVLDLGTGTGNALGMLEKYADSVVGLDRNPTLLAVAQERAGEQTMLIQGEVDKLPFEHASFELATSTGLTGALDRTTVTGFYTELARVLVPGGMYLEASYLPIDGYTGDEHERITQSSKAMLADMIVDSVSGKLLLDDKLDFEERQQLFAELGLDDQYYDVVSRDGVTHNVITVISKL
jgi:ubiquinone/menaquinone biosynthesis C-methylase UbiE